ncbi:Acyl-CoA synthetase short-chain family member 3, mitochondrial [Cyphellophora attinorum]|uniref:Acyl-CoA synthetase short-chain family member 3, mitochondrial n=1 Tax=Cyphellophora attinorum TaxID=1664694 RepID=A0A0N1GX33_9EURO|nr:Acyl-CoA synthetase short-chain family member 3, mitochondrial [Phialophora attinorum]KPI34570.1 Acyl-CoA synthetase short-chain family member 3, mitochondrial [Phialophora attinorum]
MAPNNTIQDEVQNWSLSEPEEFWDVHGKQLHWHKPYSKVFSTQTKKLKDGTEHPHWSWYPDGEISTSYNCLHRHVNAGRGENIAMIWDSPVAKQKQKFTYKQMLEEVETLAGVLREEGVKKGDMVLIYMPMIPAAIFGMLATVHLGAMHSVVFGGFAAASLAQRIDGAKPKVILTASCAIEGAKGVLDYRPFVEGAIEKSSHKPEKTIIWQRDEKRWDPVHKEDGQRNWQRLVKSAKLRGLRASPVPVKSTDGIYVIYTSGTTGLPKGVFREAGGHAAQLNLAVKYLFDVKGPGDVMFTGSDIGWVVGHCFIVYAPLMAGATTILFEGKPVGTPDAGQVFRMIEEHKVTTFFTAPTALRAIRKEDPELKMVKEIGERGGLKQLRALFLAGERSEPAIVTRFQEIVEKYAAPDTQVIDHWWSSESGSPMTGLALRPDIGKNPNSTTAPKALKIKPGSAGKPQPGFDVRIVDDDGKEVEQGGMGNIVLKLPFGPAGLTTLFNDDSRFYKGYLKRFDGKWMDTGDAGMIDNDGYVHVMSRSDDIINVAAHRFSTGAIEQAITAHEGVGEAAGHLPFAFVQPSSAPKGGEQLSAVPDSKLFKEINDLVRSNIGNIATLGGIVMGRGMIPKTRSGKTLRRVLRELVENGVEGKYDKEVNVPPTVEDRAVVDVARDRVKEYFEKKGEDGIKAKL